MDRPWLGIAAISGGLAVLAGAFAAHGLSGQLSTASLSVFETGARYHMVHSLALAVSALAGARRATVLFLVGIFLFSGSLYLLALTGADWLAWITPVGGVSLVAGWAALAWAAFKRPI
ncbi:MAG: DUF423 domain-containing protein [Rhizomicrobium sp.]